MARLFFEKLKESAISVFSIILVVIVLNFTPLINFSMNKIWAFLFGSALMILGIALFSLGADMSMTPMGKALVTGLQKHEKLDFF